MIVGVLQFEIAIPDSFSLKDKRKEVHSLRDRLRAHRNISVAEVGALDEHRRAILGVAMVSNEAGHVQSALDKLVDFIRTVPQIELLDHQIDLL